MCIIIIIYIYNIILYIISHTHTYIYIWIEINGGKIISVDRSSQLKAFVFFFAGQQRLAMKSLHKADWDDGIPRAEAESVALFCFVWKFGKPSLRPLKEPWLSWEFGVSSTNRFWASRVSPETPMKQMVPSLLEVRGARSQCNSKSGWLRQGKFTGSLSSRSPAESHRWNKEARRSCFELMSNSFSWLLNTWRCSVTRWRKQPKLQDLHHVMLYPNLWWIYFTMVISIISPKFGLNCCGSRQWFLLHWVTLQWLGLPNTALVPAPLASQNQSSGEDRIACTQIACGLLWCEAHHRCMIPVWIRIHTKIPGKPRQMIKMLLQLGFQLFHVRSQSANLWVWPILIYQRIASLCTQFWSEVLKVHTSWAAFRSTVFRMPWRQMEITWQRWLRQQASGSLGFEATPAACGLWYSRGSTRTARSWCACKTWKTKSASPWSVAQCWTDL